MALNGFELNKIKNKQNYTFIKGDICDNNLVKDIFKKYKTI